MTSKSADSTRELVACAERYMLAVKRLGEESGYNRLTYFEAPILKMPTEDMRREAHNRWLELNNAGQALTAATEAAKAQAERVPASEVFWLVERIGHGQYVKDRSEMPGLTSDPWRAARFATEREAHDFWLRLAALRDECKPIEHVFINKAVPAEPQTVWRSIDTAPKDGTKILLRDATDNTIVVGFWSDDPPQETDERPGEFCWRVCWDHCAWGGYYEPDLWHPLPDISPVPRPHGGGEK